MRGVDGGLKDQLKDEANYWKEVLRRVAVIKCLSVRGLAFRGENETLGSVHKGNYLGILKLLAKFDPFLDEHLKRFGNKGRGTPSYLSSSRLRSLLHLTRSTECFQSENPCVKADESLLNSLQKINE